MTLIQPTAARNSDVIDGDSTFLGKGFADILPERKQNENILTSLSSPFAAESEKVFAESISMSLYTNVVCSEIMNWDKMDEKLRNYNDFYLHSIPPLFYSHMGTQLIKMCKEGVKKARIYEEPQKNAMAMYNNSILTMTGSLGSFISFPIPKANDFSTHLFKQDTQTPPSYYYSCTSFFKFQNISSNKKNQ